MEGKYCTTCNEWKSYDEYQRQSERKDGHRSQCKVCCSVYKKKYTSNNWDSIQAKSTQYNNREDVIAHRRQYYFDNKEKIQAGKRQYYIDNREYFVAQRRQYYQDN